MLRTLVVSTFVLALLSAPATAIAQVQTGSIFVKAVDEQGGVLPGATVTIASPVLPQEIAGVTDAGGIYRIPGLSVGTYIVKLAMQGFQTIIRENVIVTQGATVSIDLTMRVSTVSEEVTVRGESPIVDVKSANVAVNIDKHLLETTPGGKDIWNIIEYKAPGVIFDQPDVGGNQGGLQRAMTSRGTPNSQNTQLLNGVNVNDPAAQGFSMNYYIPSAFENIQVSSGAQDISVGTAGVLINMVTKSGSNRINGLALQTYQGDATQWDNIDQTLRDAGFRPNAAAVDYITNSNFQLGGPLVRNRLFYFGSFNFQGTHVNVPGFPAVPPPQVSTFLANTSEQDTTDILAGEGKLNYTLNGSNRLEGYLSKQRYDKPNRGANASTTQDSDSKELDTFVITQIAWNSVLSDRMFLDTKLSYNNTHFPLLQKTGLQPLNDNTTGVLLRNRTSSQTMFRRRIQVVSNLQYYLPKFLGGRHEFKAGFDNGYTPEDVDVTRVDDVNLTFRSGATGNAPSVTVFNSPLHLERAVMSTALYGQDSYSIDRLTVTAGLRWERVEGYLPAQQAPPSRYFPEGLVFEGVTIGGVVQNYTVRKQFPAVRNNPLWYNFAPRVHATYDLSGRGKTVAKFSAGRYLDQIGTGTPPNPNASISQTYAWNDVNGDLIFQPGDAVWNGRRYVGGEFGGTNNPNPTGLAVATFDRSLKRPKRNEYTFGVDHELFPDVLLSVDYIQREERDVTGQVDQSLDLWDQLYTPVTLTEPGRDGLNGTADDQSITAYGLNPGAVVSSVTVNDDRLAVRYKGLATVVTKRYSNGWTLLAGYDYSHTKVDLLSLANPNAARVNADGEFGGRRHNFKASGSYMLPYQVLVAGNLRWQSGLPITRTVQLALPQGNVNVNAEPRGSVRLPALSTIDVRAGRYFRVGTNQLELSMDVYNLANSNTTWNVRTNTGRTLVFPNGDPAQARQEIASFLSPTGVLGPRIIRFNVTYVFGRQ
jgi:hypothetical protein